MKKKKIIRITTVPISMNKILEGQLSYISKYYDLIGVSKYVEKDFKEIEEREGIRMISIPLERTIKPSQDIISLYKLILLFRKEKPDIVHTHTPKAGLLGMLAAKISKVPVRLHTLGGMPLMGVMGMKRRTLEFTEKLTYRYAHRIYPNSIGLKNFILENKFTTSNKVKVLGNGSSNGVNSHYFQKNYLGAELATQKLKYDLGLKKSDFVFMFLGRMAKDKGILELVAAFKKISKSNPSLKLLLVGPLEKENSALAEETLKTIEATPAIIYPGRTDDVRAYLRLADVFVFPSHREGFPNVLLQAGAMGLPTIATDINGCNEIIINGETGILIPVKDEQALLEKMLYLQQNKEVRKRFSANLRNRIENNFTQKIIWNEVLKEYDSFFEHSNSR